MTFLLARLIPGEQECRSWAVLDDLSGGRPRTTNANWGTFFEIATKDSDVYITGIRAGRLSGITFCLGLIFAFITLPITAQAHALVFSWPTRLDHHARSRTGLSSSLTDVRLAGGHSFANFEEYTRLDVTTYTKEGTCVGFETDEKAWKCIGKVWSLTFPRFLQMLSQIRKAGWKG